ncbi:glycosyltransferase family 2 protein [Fervidobacterium riparium]|nr:hypothetical protein IB67_01630 [Fervidobacterium riparium]
MKEIVTIILNWNKSEMTIKTFENISEIEKDRTDFIIVDNGSENSEKEKLIDYAKRKNWKILKEGYEFLENLIEDKGRSSNTILYILNKNYGYAKGNNFGLRLADSLGYKYAIIANNDVILEEEVIDKLLEVILTNEDVCVVGPRIIGPNGKTQGPYFIRPNLFSELFYPIFYIFYIYYKKKVYNKKIIFPYGVIGCFMLLKLKCMKKVDFFDENTFLYSEEEILSEKMRLIRKKTAYRNDVYIKHLHGLSSNEHGEKKKFLFSLKSGLYYYEKYRNYGKFRLFLVKIGRYYRFFILEPMIRKIKSVIKRIRNILENIKRR